MSGRLPRLAHARLRHSAVFDSVCDVLRNGVVVQEGGLTYTNIPCMIGVPADQSQNVDGQTVPVGAFKVILPINYTLRNGDYVQEKGRQLRVIAVTNPRSYQVRTSGFAIDIGPVPEDLP